MLSLTSRTDDDGKQYAVQMPNDPGQYVPISITPAGAAPAPVPASVVTTAPPPVVVAPAPVVVAPPVYPYYGPYYGPAYYGPYYGAGINLRWSSGGWGHHHRRW